MYFKFKDYFGSSLVCHQHLSEVVKIFWIMIVSLNYGMIQGQLNEHSVIFGSLKTKYSFLEKEYHNHVHICVLMKAEVKMMATGAAIEDKSVIQRPRRMLKASYKACMQSNGHCALKRDGLNLHSSQNSQQMLYTLLFKNANGAYHQINNTTDNFIFVKMAVMEIHVDGHNMTRFLWQENIGPIKVFPFGIHMDIDMRKAQKYDIKVNKNAEDSHLKTISNLKTDAASHHFQNREQLPTSKIDHKERITTKEVDILGLDEGTNVLYWLPFKLSVSVAFNDAELEISILCIIGLLIACIIRFSKKSQLSAATFHDRPVKIVSTACSPMPRFSIENTSCHYFESEYKWTRDAHGRLHRRLSNSSLLSHGTRMQKDDILLKKLPSNNMLNQFDIADIKEH